MRFSKKLEELFKNKNLQRDYIKLLRDSHAESMRSGKLTMDVGTQRERDLVAVLCKYLGRDCVNWSIDNKNSADVYIENVPFSIKHITINGKHNDSMISSFKVKWTSNTSAAERHIKEYLQKQWNDYIIVSEISKKFITVNIISPRQINNVMKLLKGHTFKQMSETGNTRGIEFSDLTLNILRYGCKSVRFKADVFSNLRDPIDRRLDKLA